MRSADPQVGRHVWLRPQLDAGVQQLQGLEAIRRITQTLPLQGALHADRGQRPARLPPEVQGTVQRLSPEERA